MNDYLPKHQFIPTEKFELGHKYEVRLLFYHHPSRFSVYLHQKVGPLTEFQTELQHAMHKYRLPSSTTSYREGQPVAAQDHHQIWHRATIVQLLENGHEVRVYFVDVGLEETMALTNIRPLPHEFFRQVAFAISCRLHEIFPRNSTSQLSWSNNDPVHQEFQQLKGTSLICEVRRIDNKGVYEVQLGVPEIGDFGTFLLTKNLVTRPPPVRRFPSPAPRLIRERPNSQTVRTVLPDDGQYIVTQVNSVLEFYGHSQRRERELEALQKRFQTLLNFSQDQTLSVGLPLTGMLCVIQHGDKYHRVMIKSRDSDSKVLVKLIDRGDEILVDTSELIRLDEHLASLPAFAQPFRLFGFDETQSTANITRKTKKFLLNQPVQIKLHTPMINGFHPVEIFLSDGQSLSERLLSPDPPRPLPSPVRTLTTPPAFQTIDQLPSRFASRETPMPAPSRGFGIRGSSRGTARRPFRGNRFVAQPVRLEYVEPAVGFGGSPTPRSTDEMFESAQNYPDEAIPKGQIQFVLSHFEGINDFFLQDLSTQDDLTSLTDELQKESCKTWDLPESSLRKNLPCLAKHTDGFWYRAIVLTVGDRLKVRFVDFGNTLDVERRSIRQLAKKFAEKAPMAYRCSLKDVQSNDQRRVDATFIESFAGRSFRGEFVGRSTLVSKDLKALLVERDAIRTMLKATIVYVDADRNEFYVQTNEKLAEEIETLVAKENAAPFVRPEEIRVGAQVIATYEDAPFRALIESESDNECEVYFVDFGNRCRTAKNALRKCSEKLKSFAPQARRCRLSGATGRAELGLEEFVNAEQIEIQPIDENDESQVLVYHQGQCLNDSLNSTMTTVKERQPAPTSIKGILTFVEENRPVIYLQTNPEAESLIGRINQQIEQIIREDRHLSAYKLRDQVVAQYNDDEQFYRATIEKLSSDGRTHTVFFIDYGNRDENVKEKQLYASTKELKQISPLAEEFHLEKIDDDLRHWFKEQVNNTLQFDVIDAQKKLVRLRSNEKNEARTYFGTISGVYQERFYLHLRPNCDALICEMEEVMESHPKNPSDQPWALGDLCLIYDVHEDQNRRGKILNIDHELQRYDVQCIDYGYVRCAMEEKDLFRLESEEIFQREPLAQPCRLFGVSFHNQRFANEEIIRRIPASEIVTITAQKINEQNEMLVMLIRANDDIVNDHYQSKASVDSANDPHMTSLIGIPQAESTHQYGDLTQPSFSTTIDFGENDPSITTI